MHLAVQAYARYKLICVRTPVQTNCNALLVVRSCWEINADDNASLCADRTSDTVERVEGGEMVKGWEDVCGACLCVWFVSVCVKEEICLLYCLTLSICDIGLCHICVFV